MQQALYGKLLAKRDFIAIAPPRGFLALWEPWLQESMAASRIALGARWAEIFCHAPIWRFQLGPALSGTPLVGAMMPSMDAVGRCFPLTLVTPADKAAAADDAWFAEVENLLLKTLDPDTTLAATTAALGRLPPPVDHGASSIAYHAFDADAPPAPLASLFRDQTGGSLWWTIGGDDFPPSAVRYDALPPPNAFARFLLADESRRHPAAAIEEGAIP